MAVIGKIREKSTLLLIIIGLAMLAFILGDIFSSGNSIFGGNETNVGEIAGRDIDGKDFENKVQIEINKFQEREKRPVDDATKYSIRERVWNNLLRDYVFGDQFKELGLDVSPEELYDMFAGNNPHEAVIQSFTDPNTGQFNRNAVINTIKNIDNLDPQQKQEWLDFEKALKEQRKIDKYNSLIKKGLYTTHFELKNYYTDRNRSFNIKWVGKRFVEIPDSTIEVTDSEAKEYYSNNLDEFEREETRVIEFVTFEVRPSDDDREAAKKEILDIKKEFAETEDDSTYLRVNFPKEANITLLSKETAETPEDSALFEMEEKSIVGPTLSDGVYKLVKVMKKLTQPDSVKARHILIKPDQIGYQAAFAKADSLKKLVENKEADFAQLAMQNSEDQGSAIQGGDLGWFTTGRMVPQFENACFFGKTGDITTATSEFGIHIIEIQEQAGATEKVLIGEISREVLPGTETYEKAFAEANQFAINNSTPEAFDEAAKKIAETNPLREAVLTKEDRQILDIESSRSLVKWAYSNEQGKVSNAEQFENTFVVAKIKVASDEGTAPFDKVIDDARLGALNEKKAKMILEQLGNVSSVDEAAQKLGKQVEDAQNVQFANYAITGIGTEPAVLGKIFRMEVGQTSKPIKGNNGVFIVYVYNDVHAPEKTDFSDIKSTIEGQLDSRVNFGVFEALKEKANVEDNRYKFY
jgi:peptidyl-prolyl cis-trans isomerase D